MIPKEEFDDGIEEFEYDEPDELPTFRVVVTGGRDYADEITFNERMNSLHAQFGFTELAHGGATGADELTDRWARANNIAIQKFEVTKADWREVGKSAGPKRNEKMLRLTQPELVIAFPGGRGTADCVRQARTMCFAVEEVS